MKIDTALREFTESYDREAMASLDQVSRDRSLVKTKSTIAAFNLNECFNRFRDYIGGYAEYMIKNLNDPKRSTREEIHEAVDRFIGEGLVESVDIPYTEIPAFVQRYASGIAEVIEAVDRAKSSMMEHAVDADAVGDVNDFTDKFMDKLSESFTPTMDRFLWASGYNSRKVLFGKPAKKEPAPVFI